VFQNQIIVTGGYDNVSVPSVEVYFSEMNEWEQFSSMQICRSGHALVVCKGSLYAIGGKNNSGGFEASVEKLESLDENWKFVAPMNSARGFFTAVNNLGFIFTLGGHSVEKQIMARVEKYDPSVNQWCFIRNCIIPRYDHSACVMQGKIYMVGGSNRKSLINEIECYDPRIDSWTVASTTRHPLHRFALFAN